MMSQDRTTGDEMRHVPALAFVIERVGTIYRHRVEIALEVLGSGTLPPEGIREHERHLQAASHWLERTADLARRTRHPARHEQLDPHARVRAAVDSAVDALQHLSPADFRVRAPFHKFDHSPAEAIWESVLAAGYAIGLLCESLSANDRDLWWKIYDLSPKEPVAIE